MSNLANRVSPASDVEVSHRKDRLYAMATLTLVACIGCVLIYGSWWRRTRLDESYRNSLDQSMQDYDGLLESGSPTEFAQVGSRINLLMKRLSSSKNDQDWQWRRALHLRKHSDQLEKLLQASVPEIEPSYLEDLNQLVITYRNQVRQLMTEIKNSDSVFRKESSFFLIEDSVVNSTSSSQPFHRYVNDLNEIIAVDENRPLSDDAIRQAYVLLTWMTYESAWENASVSQPETPAKADVKTAIQSLNEMLKSSRIASLRGSSRKHVVELLNSAILLLKMQSLEEHEQGFRLRPSALPSSRTVQSEQDENLSCVADWLPTLFACCANADWRRLSLVLSKLQESENCGADEVTFAKRMASRVIARLATSVGIDELAHEQKVKFRQGFHIAVTLDGGSDECSSILFRLTLIRCKDKLEIQDASLDTQALLLSEDALSSPSRVAFLLPACLAGIIEGDYQQAAEMIESGQLLEVQLPLRIAMIAMWRYRISKNGDADETQEAKLWCTTLGQLKVLTDFNGFNLATSTDGYLYLEMSAWHTRSGNLDSALTNLKIAKERLGAIQVVRDIEQAYLARATISLKLDSAK